MARVLSIPFDATPEGKAYSPMRLGLKLTPPSGTTLLAALTGLREGLVAEDATLASGVVVEKFEDAARWLLEQLNAAPDDAGLATVVATWAGFTTQQKADVLSIVEAWAALSPEDKAAVLAIVNP